MKLLFVCVENSCRSQMAEALARMKGADAVSGGSQPSGVVNPGAIDVMGELDVDMSGHASKPVNDFRDERFDAIVTMGCGDACPFIEADKHIDWEIEDPRHMDAEGFRRVRDMIGAKISALLASA